MGWREGEEQKEECATELAKHGDKVVPDGISRAGMPVSKGMGACFGGAIDLRAGGIHCVEVQYNKLKLGRSEKDVKLVLNF